MTKGRRQAKQLQLLDGPLLSSADAAQQQAWPKASANAATRQTAIRGYDFRVLEHAFLDHLAVSRRCSPRTIQAYRSDLRKVARLLEQNVVGLDVRTISAGDLQVCVASLTSLSAASVQRLIYALRSFFKWLSRRGLVERNPAVDLDHPQRARKLPPLISVEDAQQLVRACETPAERLIICLLLYCGLRCSELLELNISNVAADGTSVRVTGKAGKQRELPVHPDLQPLLRAYIDGLADGEEPLIRNNAGQRMSATSLWRLFGRLVQRAGLAGRGITPHTLRHFFASELVKAGADIVTVSELLGHSNISTTSIYVHSDGGTKRKAVALLASLGPASEDSGSSGGERQGSTQARGVNTGQTYLGDQET